jgi:hypothetical protein
MLQYINQIREVLASTSVKSPDNLTIQISNIESFVSRMRSKGKQRQRRYKILIRKGQGSESNIIKLQHTTKLKSSHKCSPSSQDQPPHSHEPNRVTSMGLSVLTGVSLQYISPYLQCGDYLSLHMGCRTLSRMIPAIPLFLPCRLIVNHPSIDGQQGLLPSQHMTAAPVSRRVLIPTPLVSIKTAFPTPAHAQKIFNLEPDSVIMSSLSCHDGQLTNYATLEYVQGWLFPMKL